MKALNYSRTPRIGHLRRVRYIASVSLLVATLSVISCDKNDATTDPPADTQSNSGTATSTLKWTQPNIRIKTRDLRSPSASLQSALKLTASEKFPPCTQIFEENDNPKKHFPLADTNTRALQIAGCLPEAYRRLADGTRYVAYATPLTDPISGSDRPDERTPEDASNLRLLAYKPDGQLAWHAQMDRSENAKNFRANYRSSYIAPILPRLVCFGTLWQGGTQASCVDSKTGAVKWSGMLPFWSGITPQPNATSLVGVSLKRLTRRYPYTGVEMEAIKFDNPGGRSSLYAADSDQFFYSSSHAETPHLTAYSLDDFKVRWTLELPAQPNPNWSHLFGELDLLLLKIDDTLYALRASTGERMWAATVGADEPPVVALNGHLYLLLRRESGPNRIFDLDSKTGEVQQFSPVPSGTLDLLKIEDTLILRSIRAVRKIILTADNSSPHTDAPQGKQP